jgi:hypothetical protein
MTERSKKYEISGESTTEGRKPETPESEEHQTHPLGLNSGEVEEPAGRSPLSRRRFLRGMVAGVGVLAAACGADDPTPTPTPTKTPAGNGSSPMASPAPDQYQSYLPQVHSSSPLVTPQPRLEPTPPKPAPTATATPVPPTPTPMTTPFPPGPPSKLGIHVERNEPQLFTLLKTGAVAVVKTLELDTNFAAQIKRTSPRTKVIGRIHLPQPELSTLDPASAARSVADQLLAYANDANRRLFFDAWEAYNEPVAANADEMKRLADFEAERVRILAEQGIRSVIANFGTGQPELDLWEHFLPAVQAAKEYDGWLGLHEYSAPTIYYLSTRENQGRYPGVAPEDTGWLTLRYRQIYNQILIPRGLAIPLVMTEMGVDGLVANRPGPQNARGWQHFQEYWAENGYGLWGPGAYVEQLVWYDRAMQQDSYVIGGTIYGMGTSSEWISYDIGNTPVIGILEQYLKVHAPV